MMKPMRHMKEVTLEVLDDIRFTTVLRLYSELHEAYKEIKRLQKINERLVARERERLGLPPRKSASVKGQA